MAASTGAAGKELEGLRDVMEDVYAANYGDSVADVGDAVAMVNRNMANLDQNGLTAATEGALALRDAFEYDVAESTRAAEAIRKNFGSSAEEAFSLIAARRTKRPGLLRGTDRHHQRVFLPVCKTGL